MQADTLLKRDHHVIGLDRDSGDDGADSTRLLIERFVDNQYRHFLDPAAPYFMFLSKSADLAMGIGGALKMRVWDDWGGSVNNSNFSPYLIPMTPDPLHRSDLGATMNGTSLFFRVIGHNARVGDFSLYIQGDFGGYNGRGFRLKKAYATISDWTIGYALSTFSDAEAYPAIVDGNGTNLSMDQKCVLVRWLRPFARRRFAVAVGVEMPDMQIDCGDSSHTAARSQSVPNVAASLRWNFAPGQHVQLAGLTRWMPWRDMLDRTDHTTMGWGLQLSATLRPHSGVTLYLVGSYGQGYASYSGDLMAGNYDLVPDPERAGRLYAPRSWGCVAGVQYNFTPWLFTSVDYSMLRYLPQKAVAPTEYKYGQFACCNVFWNITPRFLVAAEFDLGMRADFSGRHRWARRVGAMAQVSF